VSEGIREGKPLRGEAGKIVHGVVDIGTVETPPKFNGSEGPEESSFP